MPCVVDPGYWLKYSIWGGYQSCGRWVWRIPFYRETLQHGSLREFAARRMNAGGKGRRMPYLCEPDGKVVRVAPSIIRRKLRKGWICGTALPDYYIRCGTAAEEQQALSAAWDFWKEQERQGQSCQEAQVRYNAQLDEVDARRSAAQLEAQRALARRIRQQEVELLRARGLPLDVPLMGLSLPRRIKRPRMVAHGRGSAVVGVFHDPAFADH